MDELTFITKLAEFMAWPTALVIIFLVLKKPIESLLGRLSKARHKDIVFNFDTALQKVAPSIEANSKIADAIPQDPLGLIREAEQRIVSTLEQLNINSDSEKVEVLTKHHANLQLKHAYSEIYQLIYGSQIALLQALNSQSSPVDNEFLNFFYTSAKQQYPDFYKSYNFESYINFLKSVGFVKTENSKYALTSLGRGFLAYLAESGKSTNKIL